MRRGSLLALSLALIAPGLTGCGLFGDSTTLEDALETMPDTATRVTFFDRAAASDRLDLGSLDADSSDDELNTYIDKSLDLPWSTELDRYVALTLNAPFSALDIEWEAVGYDADGFGRVWKMDEDLDLDKVIDQLVDLGYEEEGSGDAHTLTIDIADIGEDEQYLAALTTMAIVPDENLIVSGPLTSTVLSAVADDKDSLIDGESFEDLVDSTDDVELADLTRKDSVCSFGNAPLSAEQIEASGVTDLASPDQAGFFVHGDDGAATSVMLFDSDGAADDAAEERETYLTDGTSPFSGQPYTEIADYDVEADGKQVRIDVDPENPKAIPGMIQRSDYPSICTPGDA
jgi:hypothetical protein